MEYLDSQAENQMSMIGHYENDYSKSTSGNRYKCRNSQVTEPVNYRQNYHCEETQNERKTKKYVTTTVNPYFESFNIDESYTGTSNLPIS